MVDVCLVVEYWRRRQWLGFDTYYLDDRGRQAGAFNSVRRTGKGTQ